MTAYSSPSGERPASPPTLRSTLYSLCPWRVMYRFRGIVCSEDKNCIIFPGRYPWRRFAQVERPPSVRRIHESCDSSSSDSDSYVVRYSSTRRA